MAWRFTWNDYGNNKLILSIDMQKMMIEPPKYGGDIIQDAQEGIKLIANKISGLFKTKSKTAETIRTVEPYVTAPVYESLTINRQIVLGSEVQKINGLLADFYSQFSVYTIDVKNLYWNIDDSLINGILSIIKVLDGTTYEEILRTSMKFAKTANNPIITGFDALPALDNFFGIDLIEADSFGVQRWGLAVIWSALLLSLFTKYTSSVIEIEKKNIIKASIALSLGTGVAFLQFCHKSPESITNYFRMLYEGYNNVRDKYNQRNEKKIPDILRLNSPRKDFASLTKDQKITVGQVLNIVYTFRVGDMFLSVLEKEKCSVLSSDIMEKAIESIWPLPSQNDVDKIFRLYTENKIYYI